MKKIIYLLSILLLITVNTRLMANEISPYQVINNVGNNLFVRLAANQQEIKKFPGLMREIVDEELMPFVDYRYAAYKILGQHLSKITAEQRDKFVTSIRSYLVRTYSTALTQYHNQQVIFEPEQPINNQNIVAVATQIIDDNRPTINIVFKMRQNKKTLEWKAFDMVVEGISLLSSKQAELSQRIAKQGVEQVTLELASIAK